MAEGDSSRKKPPVAVVLTLALFALIALVFSLAFAISSARQPAPPAAIASYAPEVAAALEGAVAAKGAQLLEDYQCSVCHLRGEGRVAPLFYGLAERAEKRRPPMPAAQYLYESILSPSAYLVPGYSKIMPANYKARLSPAEIGHIIAHLLTLSAAAQSS